MKNRYFVYLGIAGVVAIFMMNVLMEQALIAIGETLCYGLAPVCGIIFTDFWFVSKPRDGVTLRSLCRWDVMVSWIAAGIIAYGVGCALSGAVFGALIYWMITHFIERLQNIRHGNMA